MAIPIKNIHIFGAAGSGTSTLRTALSGELSYNHLDTDDYFWITKFTEKRSLPDRRQMLKHDLSKYQKCVLLRTVLYLQENAIKRVQYKIIFSINSLYP